jgi:hypothetical protein
MALCRNLQWKVTAICTAVQAATPQNQAIAQQRLQAVRTWVQFPTMPYVFLLLIFTRFIWETRAAVHNTYIKHTRLVVPVPPVISCKQIIKGVLLIIEGVHESV